MCVICASSAEIMFHTRERIRDDPKKYVTIENWKGKTKEVEKDALENFFSQKMNFFSFTEKVEKHVFRVVLTGLEIFHFVTFSFQSFQFSFWFFRFFSFFLNFASLHWLKDFQRDPTGRNTFTLENANTISFPSF